MPELTQLLRVKSMMRYLPANGTAGLARFSERRLNRSPWPPARIIASTLLIVLLILSAGDVDLLSYSTVCDSLYLTREALGEKNGCKESWHRQGRQKCLAYPEQGDASVSTPHPNNPRPYAVEQGFVLHGMIAERISFWRCFRLCTRAVP